MNNIRTNSLLRVKSTLLVLKRLPRSGTLSKKKRTTGLARLQLSLKSNGTRCKLRLIVWIKKRRLRMKNCHLRTGKLMDSKLRLRNLMMFKSKRERSKREPRKPKQAEKSSKLNSISRSLPILFKNAMKRSWSETIRLRRCRSSWFTQMRSVLNSRMKFWHSGATFVIWRTWLRCFLNLMVCKQFQKSNGKKWL